MSLTPPSVSYLNTALNCSPTREDPNIPILSTPLLTVPALLAALLLTAPISYETYHSGAKWLNLMLQPATIAFAPAAVKKAALMLGEDVGDSRYPIVFSEQDLAAIKEVAAKYAVVPAM